MKIEPETNALFEVSLKFIVKDLDGKVLLLKVPEGEPMAGYYDLPGGRIKESEIKASLKTIAQRELGEELGSQIQLKLGTKPVAVGRHEYPKGAKETGWIFWIAFEAQYQSGEITVSDEHASYEWIDLKGKDLAKLFVNGPYETMMHYINEKTF